MNRSQSPKAFAFSLETDDRTDEERKQGKVAKKDHLVSALGTGNLDGPKAPMDTNDQEEMEETKPTIRFNLNFDKKSKGVEESKEERDGKRFDIKRLFEAVASGDVMKLEGLHQYLHHSMKKLSNSEYQSYGKNALMKALLNLSDGKNNTVEFLLDISERMGDIKEFVNAAYTESYYKGQTSLHVAIERRSSYYVQILVRKGADVQAKACGKFFQPRDGPSFYFGELPLSLAACTNQPEVVDFLMDNEYQSANVRDTDSQGNTVLHALVMVADNTRENTDFVTSMYDHILTSNARLHPKCRLEDMENNQGLTPLKLAAKMGKIGLFEHILHREFQESHTKHLSRKFTEWVYGPVHSSLYDLASLDSYEDNSVLEILVYGSEIPNRHEMLEIEPLSHLVEEKWNKFASRIFFFNFLVYLAYLIVFTIIAYNKKNGTPPFPIEHTTEGYLYLSGQLLTALASCYFFVRGIIDMKRKRPNLQTLMIDGYCEIIFFMQAVFFLVSAVLYHSGRQEYLGFMVVCLALSWVNVLYFFRGYRCLGVYSVMIQKMILGDFIRFLFVYIVFLFGFSAAVVALLIESPVTNTTNTNTDTTTTTTTTNTTGRGRGLSEPLHPDEMCLRPAYHNISFTTLELFKFTIGIGDLDFSGHHKHTTMFYILIISYIILTYVLLLNMLIALMSRTVEKITMESTVIWKLQRAIAILDLEKGLPHCLRKRLRSGVEKDLASRTREDRRWCYRVEEVNWNKWNINLGIINEDPGSGDWVQPSPSSSTPETGRSWRGFFREVSRRHHMQPRHRQQTRDSTEMSPLSNTPV
ncbi:transient receptor potential cation channel subfamily V member 1 isoform 1-T2 [Polymixia lowei]